MLFDKIQFIQITKIPQIILDKLLKSLCLCPLAATETHPDTGKLDEFHFRFRVSGQWCIFNVCGQSIITFVTLHSFLYKIELEIFGIQDSEVTQVSRRINHHHKLYSYNLLIHLTVAVLLIFSCDSYFHGESFKILNAMAFIFIM